MLGLALSVHACEGRGVQSTYPWLGGRMVDETGQQFAVDRGTLRVHTL